MSVVGNYIIGMYKLDVENYETTLACLENVFLEIKNINEMVINKKMYKIEKFICGDLKVGINF